MSENAKLIDEARKAMMCLYLEVPASVADDVRAKVEAVCAALEASEREKEQIADDAGYDG